MEVVKATVWIYQIALRRAAALIQRNWVVLFAPLAYSAVLSVASVLLSPLGFIGRILLVLVTDACISSGLYLIENLLKAGRANFHDFLRGWGVYLWDIVQVSFILWVPLTVATQMLYPVPNGLVILLFLRILVYTIFNVVPELIYQARLGGLEVLAASYNFVIENWIEWFIPNLLIGVAAYLAFGPFLLAVGSLPTGMQIFTVITISSLFLSCFMIFRGVLFSMLRGSTRRSRVYRYKVGEPLQGQDW